MPIEDISFNALDNIRLAARWFYPMQTSHLAVLMVHDVGEVGIGNQRFENIANSLLELGISSMVVDLRAHGKSTGKQEEVTIKDLHRDMDVALHQVLSRGYKVVGVLATGISTAIASILASQKPDQIHCLSVWYPIIDFNKLTRSPGSVITKSFNNKVKKSFPEKKYLNFLHTNFRMGQEFFQDLQDIYPHFEASKISRRVMYVYALDDQVINTLEHQNQIRYFKKINIVEIKEGGYGFIQDVEDISTKTTIKFFPRALVL